MKARRRLSYDSESEEFKTKTEENSSNLQTEDYMGTSRLAIELIRSAN